MVGGWGVCGGGLQALHTRHEQFTFPGQDVNLCCLVLHTGSTSKKPEEVSWS